MSTAFAQQSRDGRQRPPWSTEASIRKSCTSCGACIRACPEGILRSGRAGTPVVDFDRGACTFCRACADACEEAVFDTDHAPWALIAVVGAGCFLAGGISCRSCTDVCEANALRFDLRAGPVGRVTVDAAACTGCGACAGICPAGAISIAEPEPLLEATP